MEIALVKLSYYVFEYRRIFRDERKYISADKLIRCVHAHAPKENNSDADTAQ